MFFLLHAFESLGVGWGGGPHAGFLLKNHSADQTSVLRCKSASVPPRASQTIRGKWRKTLQN
eukprot:3860512-Amphidinium_carterae.1